MVDILGHFGGLGQVFYPFFFYKVQISSIIQPVNQSTCARFGVEATLRAVGAPRKAKSPRARRVARRAAEPLAWASPPLPANLGRVVPVRMAAAELPGSLQETAACASSIGGFFFFQCPVSFV